MVPVVCLPGFEMKIIDKNTGVNSIVNFRDGEAVGWRSRWISPRAGNKLMRIFKEYGAGQLTSLNSDPDPNLNYSQALKEERGPPENSGRSKRYHHRS
ncbi:DUF3102 domain-containing protein [Desulfosporosinus lacus]|uniref:Uncharacterized protein n=1 Tax=Desulfosporosinus lacus DSM 15449 TaxID=1121420 RepID=A0A1M5ZSN5_9FIRM|nr:DUF3102 domain-containing protein [Desulfosporosinus lacus]SHI27222.1 Protein of unknown function [Desulfosporosinus lacus DSM 15449]